MPHTSTYSKLVRTDPQGKVSLLHDLACLLLQFIFSLLKFAIDGCPLKRLATYDS
jgi:hypothetical protein